MNPENIASQDFRDGAAHGAYQLYIRIMQVQAAGVTLSPDQIREMYEQIAYREMGGRLDTSTSL